MSSNKRRVVGGIVGTGIIVMLIGLLLIMSGCSASAQETAADGLDLHALMGVVRQATNGEDLERRINTAGGINNLDLQQDGKVDFIDVIEFGDGEFRGYSLAVHIAENQTQEVAEVKIHRSASEVTIQIRGNEQIYGRGALLVNHIGREQLNMVPFLVWAYAPRPLYVRPIVIGFRPSWYAPVVRVPVTQYRTVTQTVTKTVVVEKPKAPVIQTPSTVTNPNAGKTAETVKATLKQPTATQQQFQARPENKAVATGGFGANKTVVKEQGGHDVANPATSAPVETRQGFQPRDPDKKVTTGGFGADKTPKAPATTVVPRPPTTRR